MSDLHLYIGNKNYSSWSLRPWIAMTAAGIPFKETLIPFDFPAGNPRFREISPTARVPVLHHGDVRVWESLSIIDYVADLYPDAGLWPADRAARAKARSYSMEILSGFRPLRNACPMNLRRTKETIPLGEGVADDVARIETIWHEAVAASGGPFLFGTFGAADAMYAPVVTRFDTYALSTDPRTRAYIDAVMEHPAFRTWLEAGLAETWIVPEDEV